MAKFPPARLLPSLLALLFSCHQPPSSTEIQVGVILSLSGPGGHYFGEPSRQGLLMAEKDAEALPPLKKDGKIYRIRLYYEDDKNLPEEGVFAARKLINQKGVQVLLGTPTSNIAVPVALVAETRRVPLIATVASHPSLTFGKGYVFRINTSLLTKAAYLAKSVSEKHPGSRVAALFDITNPYCKAAAQALKAEWIRNGGKWAGDVTYVAGEAGKNFVFDQLRALNADFVFLPNYPDDLLLQVLTIEKQRSPFTVIGLDNVAFLESFPAEARSAYFVSTEIPDGNQPAQQHFRDAYEETFGTPPNLAASTAYDAYFLLREAIQKTNDWDSAGLASSLRSITRFNGISGSMSFSVSGTPEKALALYRAFDDAGHIKIVKVGALP